MPLVLNRATFQVTAEDLEFMVLPKKELPIFPEYQVIREGILENETLAQHGFPGNTSARFRKAGRVTGYLREFGPSPSQGMVDGFDFVAATVCHLFDAPEAVSDWMHNIFLKDFEENVGKKSTQGLQLLSIQELNPSGFFEDAVGLKAVQGTSAGVLSSTVIDFRLGRILGVAYVGTVGDHNRLELANKLGQVLEKRIVQVVLGSA